MGSHAKIYLLSDNTVTIHFGINSVDERDGILCRHSFTFWQQMYSFSILESNHARKDLTWKLQEALQNFTLHND